MANAVIAFFSNQYILYIAETFQISKQIKKNIRPNKRCQISCDEGRGREAADDSQGFLFFA